VVPSEVVESKSDFECKIVGFYERSYGKFSEDQIYMPDEQIIIEVSHYLQMLATGMPPRYSAVPGFKDWVEEDGRAL